MKIPIHFFYSLLFCVISLSTSSQTKLFSDIPVSDSGSANSIGSANTSRNVGVDPKGNIFVVYSTFNEVRLAKSTNGGESFLPSILISNTGIQTSPEININGNGTIYIAWSQGNEIRFTSSVNGGNTFSDARFIANTANSTVHLASFENNVYLIDQQGQKLISNSNNGEGNFNEISTGVSMVYADILVDQNGIVYTPMDNPDLLLFRSINQGNSLDRVNINPSRFVYFSSYALSDGPCGTFIFVGGGDLNQSNITSTTGYKINAKTGEATPITLGKNTITAEGRTLYADNKGTLIDGYKADNSDLIISVSSDQGNNFNTPIVVANGESHNIARSPTTDNIIVVYSKNGQIFTSVYSDVLKSILLSEDDNNLSFCSSLDFNLSYEISGVFAANTLFTVSLSDEFGNFNNSIKIGEVNASTSGEISCTLPNNLVTSENYRIKVESIDNCIQSNAINLVFGKPAINGGNRVCKDSSIQLTSLDLPNPSNPWTSSNTNIATVDNNGLVTGVNVGVVEIIYLSNANCTNTIEIEVEDFDVTPNVFLENCDDDFDGLVSFNLTNTENEIISNSNLYSFSYYASKTDADSKINEISDTENFINQTENSQLIWARVENDLGCFKTSQINLTVKQKPDFDLIEEAILCSNNSLGINLSIENPNGIHNYVWTDENDTEISNATNAIITSVGIYYVKATSSFGCESIIKQVLVKKSEPPLITINDIVVQDDSENNFIRVNTSNLGLGDYEFRLLDNNSNILFDYQDNPLFENLEGGNYILEVNDKNNCGSIPFEIALISFPKFFTPNGDSQNDYWRIKGIDKSVYANGEIHIFNRYGVLLKKLSINDLGWDGTYNGKSLPANDFWFRVVLVDQNDNVKTRTGNFSLLR